MISREFCKDIFYLEYPRISPYRIAGSVICILHYIIAQWEINFH